MGTEPAYVLGIDGLPLGSAVAVAIAGSLHSTFILAAPGPRTAGLSQRVKQAVADAETRLGGPPTEVRLVLVDDDGDGSEVDEATQWLAQRNIRFWALDLVGPDGVATPNSTDAEAQRARSVSRAVEAALW
jgi:hypothetical protein